MVLCSGAARTLVTSFNAVKRARAPRARLARCTERCLYLIAGWSGYFVMGIELLGGRLLAPYFGSSIYVWGAIITVFMLALSLGYLLGGRASLYAPSLRRLALILLAAAVTTLPVLLLGDSLLDHLSAAVTDPRFGSLTAAVLLFFLPTCISGMVSPYAVRLLVADRASAGHLRRQAVLRVHLRQRRRHAR